MDKLLTTDVYFHQVQCDKHEYQLVTLTATGQAPVKWWQCKNCCKTLLPSSLQKPKKNGN